MRCPVLNFVSSFDIIFVKDPPPPQLYKLGLHKSGSALAAYLEHFAVGSSHLTLYLEKAGTDFLILTGKEQSLWS